MVRSEALRGHSDTSMHSALRASCIDWSSWPLRASDLTMHNTSCLNPIITWIVLVLIHYEAKIYKPISEAGGDESCIVENLCMVLYVTCIATPLWRHNDSGVTKSPQNMNANMFKWEIIWIVRFVNCVSIDFNEIYVNSNINSGSIL